MYHTQKQLQLENKGKSWQSMGNFGGNPFLWPNFKSNQKMFQIGWLVG